MGGKHHAEQSKSSDDQHPGTSDFHQWASTPRASRTRRGEDLDLWKIVSSNLVMRVTRLARGIDRVPCKSAGHTSQQGGRHSKGADLQKIDRADVELFFA
jgi:hypothetical protein